MKTPLSLLLIASAITLAACNDRPATVPAPMPVEPAVAPGEPMAPPPTQDSAAPPPGEAVPPPSSPGQTPPTLPDNTPPTDPMNPTAPPVPPA